MKNIEEEIWLTINSSIQNIAKFEDRGDLDMTLLNCRGVIFDFLWLAVIKYDCFKNAKELFCNNSISKYIELSLNIKQNLIQRAVGGRVTDERLGVTSLILVEAHMAWCVDRFDLAEKLICLMNSRAYEDRSTPFWKQYRAGLYALLNHEPFTPVPLKKMAREEKYWWPYLQLIAAASKNEPQDALIQEIDALFIQRNADKKIHDMAIFEGDGYRPVKWDFRKDTLLHFLANRK